MDRDEAKAPQREGASAWVSGQSGTPAGGPAAARRAGELRPVT